MKYPFAYLSVMFTLLAVCAGATPNSCSLLPPLFSLLAFASLVAAKFFMDFDRVCEMGLFAPAKSTDR